MLPDRVAARSSGIRSEDGPALSGKLALAIDGITNAPQSQPARGMNL